MDDRAVLLERRDALRVELAKIEAALGEEGDRPNPEDRRASSAEELTSLLDEVEVGIWSVSFPALETVYANPAFTRILGRPREELETSQPSIIPWLHPDDQPRARQARAARVAGKAGALEARVVRPDGEERWCRFEAHTVVGARGAVDRIDMLVTDIHDKRLAEASVASRERRFRRLVEHGWDVVALFDRDWRLTYLSDSVTRVLGWAPEEYAALPPSERVHPEDVPALARLRQDVLASPGAAERCQIRVRHKRGAWVWTESFATNLLDDPDVRAVVVNVRDADERVRAEAALAEANTLLKERVDAATEELRMANAALLKAARSKDEFLANMSHELRTPLNAVLGLAEALHEGVYGEVTERARRALTRIDSSGRHLLSLLSDILDLSKIEAGKAGLELKTIAVGEVCRASLAMVEGAARAKRINVSVQISDGFAAIQADERRLKQILVNLLSNAVKFTSEGGQAGLDVRADEAADQIVFTVWDTGIGIAPDALGRLFQPFVQIDSSLTRSHEGAGLGLALVRKLVDLHGGAIEVESTPRAGSRFMVRLPMHHVAARSRVGQGARALIVEDSAPAAEQLARYVEEVGLGALVHPGASGVVERAVVEQPVVILLDILLPAEQGFQVLRDLQAHARTSHIPVIVVSVLDRRAHALDAGAVDHVLKPITREAVHDALARATCMVAPRAPSSARPVAVAAPKILIADDDETNVATVIDFLQSKGYEVFAARDGVEALSLARELLPEVIFMDVQMPRMDGLSAMRELRADPRPEVSRIPLIALTALAMAGDRERCLAAGAFAYLSKPVSLRELAATLESAREKR